MEQECTVSLREACSAAMMHADPPKEVWTESQWYAVTVRPRHEKTVRRHLQHRGLNCFVPFYRSVRRWKDRQKELQLPLFPNYVFIHGGLNRMLSIVTTPGVHSLVSWSARPANIAPEEIEAIRRLVNSPLQVEPHPFLKCGDKVRIKAGALEGLEGILVRKRGSFRLVLSVEMLSKSAAVEVDVSTVERMHAADAPTKEKLVAASSLSFPVPNRPYVLVGS